MEVFFLAFSNDPVRPLSYLKDEADAVYDYALMKARDRHFLPYYAPYASVKQMNQKMQDFTGQISVFLYSGHADGNEMFLQNSTGNTDGIGMHLEASIKSGALKLVVLNGCATKPAVQRLLDIGVPVVIATQASINDEYASIFSKTFFENLVENDKSIIDSFNAGLKAVKTANSPLNLEKREIKTKKELEKIPDNTPLWEIFAEDNTATERTIIPPFNPGQAKFRANEKLLKTIYTSFYNAGNQLIADLWKEENENEARPVAGTRIAVRKSQKENAICETAPMPVSVQLQLLLGSQLNSPAQRLEHLSKLVQLFQTLNEFLAFIMISQLWEIKLKCEHFTISDTIRTMLNQFFDAGKERDNYNYANLIITIRNFISNCQEDPACKGFIEKQVIVSDFARIDENKFRMACDKLLTIRMQAGPGLNDTQINQYNIEAEENLCVLFSMLGFIHRYELNSIHSIETLKKRYQRKEDTRYRHSMFSLSQTSADDLDIISMEYMDSYGQVVVIRGTGEYNLTRNDNWVVDYLNLSPFVIDINAFEDRLNTTRIMFFDVPVGNSYRYRDIRTPNLVENKKEVSRDSSGTYTHVMDELEAFKTTMLNS